MDVFKMYGLFFLFRNITHHSNCNVSKLLFTCNDVCHFDR